MRVLNSENAASYGGVRILKVDPAGTPVSWLSPRAAICYVAQNDVLWSLGEPAVTFKGGNQRTGVQSILHAPPILAIKSPEKLKTWVSNDDVLPLRRESLFRRDRHVCAYCGVRYDIQDLTVEHVIPKGLGGKNIWTNVVSACQNCNQRKDCRTPEQAKMPLLYLPYAPNRFEYFILAVKSSHILGDQMEYLIKKVGSNSRLHEC